MSSGEVKSSESPGGESQRPALTLEDEITTALGKRAIEKENLAKQGTPVPSEIPHARERIIVASAGMFISIIAATVPWTPDNIRPGMLSIATVIATALVKPFEKNG